MKKGIIIEIDDAFLTLLTPDGQFLKAKKRNNPCTIGEEILFTPVEFTIQKPFFLKRFIALKPLSAAAAAILLFLGAFIPVYENNKVYAYISIDINPSIEMELNNRMKVIKLTPYNQDGKKVLTHISNWKNKEACDVSKLLLNEMKKEGYLKEHHSVIISTVRVEKLQENAEKLLNAELEEIENAIRENHLQLTVVTGTEQDLEKAHQLGITTGKYKESKFDSPSKQESTKQQEEHTADKNGAILPMNKSIRKIAETDLHQHPASSGKTQPIEITQRRSYLSSSQKYFPPRQQTNNLHARQPKRYLHTGEQKQYFPAAKPKKIAGNTMVNVYVHNFDKKAEHPEKKPKQNDHPWRKHWDHNVVRKTRKITI